MTDSALARDLLHALNHHTHLSADDVAADVRRIIAEHDDAAAIATMQAKAAGIISDPFDAVMASPLLNILAELTAHAGRIAANTTRAPEHVPAEKVLERWPLRMHEEMAVPYVRSLGIEVDE